MGAGLEIRTDLASPAQLRALAPREQSPRTATRMLAIATALEGKSRAEAVRLAGIERQALRDAVVRYQAEGLGGLWPVHEDRYGQPYHDGHRENPRVYLALHDCVLDADGAPLEH